MNIITGVLKRLGIVMGVIILFVLFAVFMWVGIIGVIVIAVVGILVGVLKYIFTGECDIDI